jgi:hypothetical protein
MHCIESAGNEQVTSAYEMNRLRCLWQGARCELELELALQSTVPSAHEELKRGQGLGLGLGTPPPLDHKLRGFDSHNSLHRCLKREVFMNLLKKVVCFVYHADYKGFLFCNWK